MALDLQTRPQIETGLFCRIEIPNTPSNEIILVSDYYRAVEIDSETYSGIGQMLTISDTSQDLRSTPGQLSVTLTAIPNGLISTFFSLKVKGSSVRVYRMLFDAATGEEIPGINPLGRFNGNIVNYNIEENYDVAQQQATSNIVIQCASKQEQLMRKVSGRRTNPADEKALYPGDLSFDRVMSLANTNLNWGAPE